MLRIKHMKTSVIMKRQLGVNQVRQETKTQFFNANDLLEAYRSKDGSTLKEIHKYISLSSTQDYMKVIMQEEGSVEKPYYAKRGKNGGTWMHPYLFIDFAMWLSPSFKYKVVKWIYDNLIKNRIESGDTFKEVNSALFNSKPNSLPYEYSNEARMINNLVFGKPEGGQRNEASEQQLDMLKRLQVADAKLIKNGRNYFQRYEDLKKIKEAFLLTEK